VLSGTRDADLGLESEFGAYFSKGGSAVATVAGLACLPKYCVAGCRGAAV